jgi:hypothetical protein
VKPNNGLKAVRRGEVTPYTSLDRIEAAKQQGRIEEKGEEKVNGKEKTKGERDRRKLAQPTMQPISYPSNSTLSSLRPQVAR